MDSKYVGGTIARSRWSPLRWTAWSIAILLASCWPLLFWRYGFEVADTGWYAVLSRDFFSRPDMIATASPWYLTWAIGACLTAHSGENAWLMLRLVGFLPYLVTSLAVAALSLRFKAPLIGSSLGILCASVLSYSCVSVYIINYNTIAAAFSCIGVCAVLLSCFNTKSTWTTALVVLGGVFIALAAASRLISILSLIPACLCLLITGIEGNRWKHMIGLLLGLIAGILLVGIFAASAGNLAALTGGLWTFLRGAIGKADGTSHSAASVSHIWIHSFGHTVVRAVAVTLVLGLLRRLLLRKIIVYRVLSVVILILLTVAVGRHDGLYDAMPLIILGLACLDLDKISFFSLSNPIPCVVTTGFVFAVVFSLGSTNGFHVSLFADWILLPFLPQLTSDKRGRQVIVLALAMLAILGARKSCHPYWDHKINDLHCQFSSGVLQGIFSQCNRISDVEGVVNAIDTHSQANDRIFVAQNSPGLYVLANRQVWGDSPWPYLRSAVSMAKLFAVTSTPPKLFILDRKDVFNADWPGGQPREPIQHVSGEKKHWSIYLEYLRVNRYTQIYQNSTWVVFRYPTDISELSPR